MHLSKSFHLLVKRGGVDDETNTVAMLELVENVNVGVNDNQTGLIYLEVGQVDNLCKGVIGGSNGMRFLLLERVPCRISRKSKGYV